ncbi:MAG: response regulator [Deltaproteobacteria bacterium]|nr:response regulator [Deltaproteobacteria bacterium]
MSDGLQATILVVDDHEPSRDLAREILEYRGFRVAEAGSMDEALAAMGSESIDLVVMDLRFPGGGGEALLRKLRENDRDARLPTIAVTGYAMKGDRERVLSLGFDDYVSKPIDTDKFADLVASHVARRRR